MIHSSSIGGKFSINHRKLLLLLICFLTVIRVILSNKIQLRFRCNEYYDDQLLFEYAYTLLSGNWLGTYHNMTLTKGISYPVFIVLCNILSLSYTTGLSLLNIGSAFTFLRAVSPRLKNVYIRSIIYILLIYSPTGFSAYITQRTYRMAIIPYAVLLLLSCLTGIYFRKDQPLKKWCLWIIGTSVSLSFFWYIREDSIWILPTIFVIQVLILLYYIKQRCKIRMFFLRAFVLFIPFLILGMSTLFICGMNYKHYGIFAVNDRTGTEFGNMMSNLYRIEDKNAPDYCWVSKEQLQNAIDASPTLASVKAPLYSSGNAWSNGEEIPGDLVAWAVRNGLQDAGYYKDAVTINEFCRQVNEELEISFQNHTLTEDTSFHFTSQSKGITMSDIPELLKKSVKVFCGIGEYNITGLKSDPFALGDIADIRKCEVMFGNRAYYSPPDETSDTIDTKLLSGEDPVKAFSQPAIKLGNIITKFYIKLAPLINFAACMGYIILCFYMIYMCIKKAENKYADLWLVITGFGLSAFVLVGGVVFFTSWFSPEQDPFIYYYSAGAYQLIQVAKYITLYCVLCLIWRKDVHRNIQS